MSTDSSGNFPKAAWRFALPKLFRVSLILYFSLLTPSSPSLPQFNRMNLGYVENLVDTLGTPFVLQ